MRYTLLTLLYFYTHWAQAQKIDISETFSIGLANGYGAIGKYENQFLTYVVENDMVKVKAFDEKMYKVWDKKLETERKLGVQIIDVIAHKQDFDLVYQIRKKGKNYLKIHKYDGKARLIDSSTVIDLGRDINFLKFENHLSDDKRHLLLYHETMGHLRILSISLDSIKLTWEKLVTFKEWGYYAHFEQVLVNNKGEAFFIREEDNKISEDHRFDVHFLSAADDKKWRLPLPMKYNLDAKFGIDNANNRLVGVGLFSIKTLARAQGYYILKLSPQYGQIESYFHAFDDELVGALLGKKATENKGLLEIKIQELIFRRDGGFIVVMEQVRIVERRMNTTALSSRVYQRGDMQNIMAIDYFYDNAFAFAISPEGVPQQRFIFYKKQASHDDEARFCSYFLFKTTSTLRLLFNDDIERATMVSEYVVSSNGNNERHGILNTDGLDLYLRLRDALQVSATELLIPSDDRHRLKWVKVSY